jgi:hypothetical protein
MIGVFAVARPGASQTAPPTKNQPDTNPTSLPAHQLARMHVRVLGPDHQPLGNFAHGDEQDGLAAFLVVHADRYKVGEYVRLSFGVMAVGTGTIPAITTDWQDWKMRVMIPGRGVLHTAEGWISITGPDGKEVPYRGMVVDRIPPRPTVDNTVLLELGQFAGSYDPIIPPYSLINVFDLSRPGKYTAQWHYRTPPNWMAQELAGVKVWSGELASNKVTFEIQQ